LELADLAEKNRRRLLEIDDKLYEYRIALIERFSSRWKVKQSGEIEFFNILSGNFSSIRGSLSANQFGTYQENLRKDIGETINRLKEANKLIIEFDKNIPESGGNRKLLEDGKRLTELSRDLSVNELFQKQETYKVLSKAAKDLQGGKDVNRVDRDILEGRRSLEKHLLETQKQCAH
jgi:hypothetical protein